MRVKIILLLFISSLFLNCSIKKEPKFTGIKQIKIVDKTSRSIQFEVLLEFKNPNLLGGTFSSENLSVYVNDFNLSQLKSPLFEVPALSDFTMPILVSLDAKSFKGRELEIISSILKIGMNKKIDLKIEGPLDYKIIGYSSVYNVKYEDSIDLNKN